MPLGLPSAAAYLYLEVARALDPSEGEFTRSVLHAVGGADRAGEGAKGQIKKAC